MYRVDLAAFERAFESWVARERPSIDIRFVVVEWIHSLQLDPFQNATRVVDLGWDWWFASVGESSDGEVVVSALFRVDESRQSVQISVLSSLHFPN